MKLNRFSELIEEAQVKGPQIMLSIDEYRSLTAPVPDFKTFFMSIPKIDLELERDQNYGRDLDIHSMTIL